MHRCRLLCVCMARESWLLMVLTMGTKQQTAIENTVSTCSLLQWTFLQWVCFVCNNESWNTLACGNKFFIYKTRAHIMLMIIAFYCGIIDTNKPFMIQIFGTQRYMLKKKTLGNGSTSQPRHLYCNILINIAKILKVAWQKYRDIRDIFFCNLWR